MTEFLVIRLDEQADQPVSWIAVDDRGTRRGQPARGTLEAAGTQAGDRPVIVLVPASQAVTYNVEIPAKGSRLLAALPYALEDQLADDVEFLHFAPGKRHASGVLPVTVVSQAMLADWLERLEIAGIRPTRIVPENHGLSVTPNTLSLLVTGEQIFFNDGQETSFAIAGLSPGEALAATGVGDEEEDNSARHLLVYCDAAVNDQYEKDWALLRHDLASVDVNLLPDGVLPRLAVTVASGAGINLLQGQYGPKTEVSQLFAPWKTAAIFLLVLGLVGLVGKAADYARLAAERDALQQQFSEVYREVRPNDTREIVDPVGTVSSLRGGMGAGSSAPQVFLPSLLQLAAALRANDAAIVEAVTYRAGVINVRLSAPDISTLDSIVQAVSSSGRFSASLQSANNIEDRVNARIEVREAGS
jgi:general secretion pathway protein L